ncbi:MAG: lantibiotic dehydratase [Lewinellaceae bacterium]|nr:lantibiotic dehydratase [Lewinellaceae bacterium]
MLVRSAGLPFARIEALATTWETAEKALQVGRADLADRAAALQTAFDAALSACTDPALRTAVYNARRDFFQRRRLPAPALETRLTAAASELTQAIRHYRQSEVEYLAAGAAYAAHYETALAEAYRQLQGIAGEPEFQRALLFSSHALLEELPRFAEIPVGQFAKKERRTARSVLQYATRMATKTTPLSRFATVSALQVEQDDLPEMPLPTDTWPEAAPTFGKSIVTPNVVLLEALYAVLLTDPTFLRALPLALNPCITGPTPGACRWLFHDGAQERFQEAAANPMLDFIAGLLLENQRRMPFEKLLETIVATTDLERAPTEAYLIQLADVGFLEWVLPVSGLSADWCSSLYRFLGFLPAEPLMVDAAALLQWLRTTARTLAYLPVSEAMAAQRNAGEQVRLFFERHGATPPPVPPEQLFYEDTETGFAAEDFTAEARRRGDTFFEDNTPPRLRASAVKKSASAVKKNISAVPETLLDQLAEAWRRRPRKPIPQHRAAFLSFVLEKTKTGQAVGFLDVARAFLEEKMPADLPAPVVFQTDKPDKIGALLQVFWENDRPCAVVNALYPGGGKMFARWLHLFPPHIGRIVCDWPTQNSKLNTQNSPLAFPWQGYFNANLQPALTADALCVPGGRVQAGIGGRSFLLGDLDVATENGALVLRDRVSGQPIELTDLGLEAPETRPPVLRLLWQLAVPYVSLEALLPEAKGEGVAADFNPLNIAKGTGHGARGEGVLFRPRLWHGDLVLARAAWAVPPAMWQNGTASPQEFFQNVRETFAALGVPRHFFARIVPEKPQAFDRDSPLSMLLFQKIVQQGTGTLYLSEMLPVPEARAEEIVVEIMP